MKGRFPKSGFPAVFLASSGAIWLYVWLRASSVQFSIDEAATFFMYIQPGRFIPPFSTVDANNHILNSFLSWASFQFFSSHPLMLRLPNILSALLYFYFTYKISTTFHQVYTRWFFMILLLGIHFLVEFFAYSRGYGLSMAFLLGSIYYALMLISTFRLSAAVKAFIFILLGVLSNLNLLFTALAMVLFISTLAWANRKMIPRNVLAEFSLVCLLAVLPVITYLIYVSFDIREHSGFYYGSADGFLSVTVKSMAMVISGPACIPIMIHILTLLTVLTVALSYFLMTARTKILHVLPSLLILLLLISNWAGSVIIHEAWNVNYQEDRAAMHYYPLCILFFCLGMDRLVPAGKPVLWAALLPLLAIPFHSVRQVSLNSSVYGNRQQIPESYFRYITSNSEERPYPPLISAWQTRKQPWAFLNYRNGGRLNPIQNSGYPAPQSDFIIMEDYLQDSVPSDFRTAVKDGPTRTILFERHEPPGWRLLHAAIMDSTMDLNQKYFSVCSVPLTADSIHCLLITLDYKVYSRAVPLEAAFVAQVFNSKKVTLNYEAIDLDQLRPQWDQTARFTHSILIHGLMPEAESLLLYFWSKNDITYTLGEGKAEIYY